MAEAVRGVVLFERGRSATGASLRNFGMVWPIGQPAGEMHRMALRSREIWLEVLSAARLSYRPTGSLHVAHYCDEAEVLRKFAEIGPRAGYLCSWLDREQTLKRSCAVQEENPRGALWSGTEMTVDPREVASNLGAYLQEMGVERRYSSMVKRIELPIVETSAV
jgi:glycine/D-amino acid oxidase-like deaminating enzyme